MVKMEGRAIRRIKGRQVVVRDLIFMNFSGFVLLKTNIFLRSEKKCIAPTQIDILYYSIFRTEESPFLSALIVVHNRLYQVWRECLSSAIKEVGSSAARQQIVQGNSV